MTKPTWKPWPEECFECGYELEVFNTCAEEATAADGDPVRCPECGAAGHISCDSESEPYAFFPNE